MKWVHGPPKKIYVGEKKSSKTVIDSETLFRIKSEVNISGRKIIKMAKILKAESAVKIEKNFSASLIDKNHLLDDFFDCQEVNVYIYDYQDFQLFEISDEGYLMNKVKLLHLLSCMVTYFFSELIQKSLTVFNSLKTFL